MQIPYLKHQVAGFVDIQNNFKIISSYEHARPLMGTNFLVLLGE